MVTNSVSQTTVVLYAYEGNLNFWCICSDEFEELSRTHSPSGCFPCFNLMFLFERRMAGNNPQDWSSMYNLIYFSGQGFGRGWMELGRLWVWTRD